ncbi:MAG TPA: hypothetical protein VGQ98_07545 [Gemmatimonadaceae bacterium]|nr:hypothetical protein [Gemmatimonadaceae bacterium]
MTVRILRSIEQLTGIAALGVIVGCASDMTGSDRRLVQFSFTTHVAAAPGSSGPASDQTVDAAGNLVLSRVQLVFRKLELDSDGAMDCVGDVQINDEADDDHGRNEEECEAVSRDPIFVDMDIPDDGTLKLTPMIPVPLAKGTFSQLEAKLGPAKDKFTDFNATHPELVGNSVRVQGKIKHNGELVDFDFHARVRAKLEMELDPPLIVDGITPTNATVSIDVSKWFLDSSGSVIDPTTATPGSRALEQIENNIRRSFHAFEDDHERGEDHHEGHDGNDDGGSH